MSISWNRLHLIIANARRKRAVCMHFAAAWCYFTSCRQVFESKFFCFVYWLEFMANGLPIHLNRELKCCGLLIRRQIYSEISSTWWYLLMRALMASPWWYIGLRCLTALMMPIPFRECDCSLTASCGTSFLIAHFHSCAYRNHHWRRFIEAEALLWHFIMGSNKNNVFFGDDSILFASSREPHIKAMSSNAIMKCLSNNIMP